MLSQKKKPTKNHPPIADQVETKKNKAKKKSFNFVVRVKMFADTKLKFSLLSKNFGWEKSFRKQCVDRHTHNE